MRNKYEAVLFVGPPGSGKGTQAKYLVKLDGFFHFSTGEMFRDLNTETDLGRKVKGLIDNGKFVDDDTTVNLAKETLDHYVREGKLNPEKDCLILDGMPRNIPQVDLVNKFIDIQQVVEIYAPDETCKQRIFGRAKKEGRADDSSLEKIEKRLEIYHSITEPVLERYERVLTIDSLLDPLEVHKEILKTPFFCKR